MFQFFKSKAPAIPPFATLAGSPIRNQYFFRLARWSWLSKQSIVIYDPNGPRVFTLDAWPQLTYLAADGSQTVESFVQHMAGLYDKEIPKALDETILHQINQLLELRIIGLDEIPPILPDELLHPGAPK